MRATIVPLIGLSLTLAACSSSSSSDPGDRGGKTDQQLYGSCDGACGDMSLDGNCWCDSSCTNFGDCCDDLVPMCRAGFESFLLGTAGGPCPPDVDCHGYVELSADGTLKVDVFGELPETVHEFTVSEADLNSALLVLTDPALVDLLDSDDELCPAPTDIYEQMKLTIDGTTHEASTTFCDIPELNAAREAIRDLVDAYLDDEEDFVSFRYATAGGPCPPNIDCNGYVELAADGTLRVDKFGEMPVVVHEATVTGDELAAAIPVLTDPALIEVLEMSEPPCVPPSDIWEDMTLTTSSSERNNSVTFCDIPAINAAREVMDQLSATYFPD